MFRKFKLIPVSEEEEAEAPLGAEESKSLLPVTPNSADAKNKTFPTEQVLQNVDPSVKGKARKVLNFLSRNISYNPENLNIIYEGNKMEEGSNIADLLNSVLLPTAPDTEIPYDSAKFSAFAKNHGVPPQLFSQQAKTRLSRYKEPVNLKRSAWKSFA
jgi:hypothetical protein